MNQQISQLESKEWINLGNSEIQTLSAILALEKYFRIQESDMANNFLVKDRTNEIIELKIKEGSRGYAFTSGKHHDIKVRGLETLNYKSHEITFRFDDYQNQMSGFAWRRTA